MVKPILSHHSTSCKSVQAQDSKHDFLKGYVFVVHNQGVALEKSAQLYSGIPEKLDAYRKPFMDIYLNDIAINGQIIYAINDMKVKSGFGTEKPIFGRGHDPTGSL